MPVRSGRPVFFSTLGVPKKQPVPSYHHGPFLSGGLNLINSHLTAFISLDIQEIKTYDIPKNSRFLHLHIDITYFNVVDKL